MDSGNPLNNGRFFFWSVTYSNLPRWLVMLFFVWCLKGRDGVPSWRSKILLQHLQIVCPSIFWIILEAREKARTWVEARSRQSGGVYNVLPHLIFDLRVDSIFKIVHKPSTQICSTVVDKDSRLTTKNALWKGVLGPVRFCFSSQSWDDPKFIPFWDLLFWQNLNFGDSNLG